MVGGAAADQVICPAGSSHGRWLEAGGLPAPVQPNGKLIDVALVAGEYRVQCSCSAPGAGHPAHCPRAMVTAW